MGSFLLLIGFTMKPTDHTTVDVAFQGYEPLLRAVYERGPVGVSVAARTWQLGTRFGVDGHGWSWSTLRTVNQDVQYGLVCEVFFSMRL